MLKMRHLSLCFLFLLASVPVPLRADLPKIAVSQIVFHPSLDRVYEGIRQGLEDEGYVDQKNCEILYENAQGRMPIAVQIAQKFASEDPAVVVGISTPSTQTLMNAFKERETPIVFASISDPVGARFVESLDHPGANVTGTKNPFMANSYAKSLKKSYPKTTKVGVLLNLSEANSVTMLEQLKKEFESQGMSVVEAPVAGPMDVKAAAESLVGKIDLLFLIQDNTVATALSSFLPMMSRNKIPTIACFEEALDQGALMALYVSEFKIGYETGKIIARILKGEKPKDIPVVTPQGMETQLNENVESLLR